MPIANTKASTTPIQTKKRSGVTKRNIAGLWGRALGPRNRRDGGLKGVCMQSNVVEKQVVCSSCDGFCPVSAKVVDGQVVKVAARKDPFLKGRDLHEGGLRAQVLRASGSLDGAPATRPASGAPASGGKCRGRRPSTDIAKKLSATIDRYGPEAFAVATSNWNTTVDSGLSRRFMNLLGSPNWISGVAYCMGNTAAVNRMVYGWYPPWGRAALEVHRAFRTQPEAP